MIDSNADNGERKISEETKDNYYLLPFRQNHDLRFCPILGCVTNEN